MQLVVPLLCILATFLAFGCVLMGALGLERCGSGLRTCNVFHPQAPSRALLDGAGADCPLLTMEEPGAPLEPPYQHPGAFWPMLQSTYDDILGHMKSQSAGKESRDAQRAIELMACRDEVRAKDAALLRLEAQLAAKSDQAAALQRRLDQGSDGAPRAEGAGALPASALEALGEHRARLLEENEGLQAQLLAMQSKCTALEAEALHESKERASQVPNACWR